MHSISKCTLGKLYPFVNVSNIDYELFKKQSLQKKSVVHLWKCFLVDHMEFKTNSLFIPDKLLMEVENQPLICPSSVYAYFLKFLCHCHLNNVKQCQDTLQELQLVIEESYLVGTSDLKPIARNRIGVALQIVGDNESAQVFLQSFKKIT